LPDSIDSIIFRAHKQDFPLSIGQMLVATGAYVLQDSIRNCGRYAEEGILTGAVLSSLPLLSMFSSIKRHLFMKGLERHMSDR